MFFINTVLLAITNGFTIPFRGVSCAFSFLMKKIRLAMSTELKMELLVFAATWGFPFILDWLYEDIEEKNPKLSDSGTTLLHFAANNGHHNICKKIIENISDKNPLDKDTWTPLHCAAQNGHLKVCEYISKNIEENNPKGLGDITPLHIAAQNGHFGVCKYILKNTTDKDPKDANGSTPYDLADYNDHSKICELIAEERGDKDYQHRSIQYHCLNRQIQNHLNNFSNLIKSSTVGTCNAANTTYPFHNFPIWTTLESLFGYPITKYLLRNGYEMTSGNVANFIVMNPVNVKGYVEWNQFRKNVLCEDSRKVELTCINKQWFFCESTNRIESTFAKSIQAAYSYAKIFVRKFDPLNSFLTEQFDLNLTIIFLNGGLSNPGQGPSAGCIIASCFISFALQKPIKDDLVMTGTISPEGKIGFVGGISGKVIGSIKDGMKKIILPKENQADFETLPAKIKDSITVHYAETFQDIYNIAFESGSFSEV